MLIRQFFRPDAEIRDTFFFKEISPYADASCLLTLGHTHILTTLSIEYRSKKEASAFPFPEALPSYSTHPEATEEGPPSSISFSLQTFGDEKSFRKAHFQVGLEKVLYFLNQKTPLKNLHFDAKCYILNDDGNSFSAAALSLQHVFSETVQKYLNQSLAQSLPPIFAMSSGLFGQQIFVDLDAQEERKADALAYFIFNHKGELLFSYAYAQSASFSAMNFIQLADLSFHQSKKMKIWPLKISKDAADV